MDAAATGKGLPENAYRDLKSGEQYVPIVPADQKMPEVTFRSLFVGILMSILFAAAAAFLGLKVGNVIEAAIPIAIIAIGLGVIPKRKSTILENVIIQSVGGASGLVVAGSIFTLPALFILGLDNMVSFFQLFLVAVLGGVMGMLFLIPLRKYFCAEMHGKYPFPEATAVTEVLAVAEKGDSGGAKILAVAAVVGGVYDFLCLSLRSWAEIVSTATFPIFSVLTTKVKMIFSVNTGAAITGIGYIIGLRFATIIVSGSLLTWFILIPLFNYIGSSLLTGVPNADAIIMAPATIPFLNMSAQQLFSSYVRYIGIGGIFAAGVIGIIKCSKIIWKGFASGIGGALKSKKSGESKTVVRTNRDIKMLTVMIAMVLSLITMLVFFKYSVLQGLENPWELAIIASIVVFVISFLFTTVAVQAIAIVGLNPVSGMTLMTLILASLLLTAFGLKGEYGMLVALLVGGVVCTSLSMAGGGITDLKAGYWIGSTPRSQQLAKIFGTIFAAATVGVVIIILNKVYGFTPTAEHTNPLPAPQANAMAAVIKAMMSNAPIPWMLYAAGAILAIIVNWLGISPLAFMLGMYLPLPLTAPLVIGGFISHAVEKSAKGNTELGNARREKGTLIASGLIAGGALMGVFGAAIAYFQSEKGIKILPDLGMSEGVTGSLISIAVFAGLCLYIYISSKRVKS